MLARYDRANVRMVPDRIPTTTDELTTTCTALQQVLSASEWRLSAILYACTDPAPRRLSTSGQLPMSISAFSALGIRGMTSRQTITKYRSTWTAVKHQYDLPELHPGMAITPDMLPPIPWNERPRPVPDRPTGGGGPRTRERKRVRADEAAIGGKRPKADNTPETAAPVLDTSPERAKELVVVARTTGPVQEPRQVGQLTLAAMTELAELAEAGCLSVEDQSLLADKFVAGTAPSATQEDRLLVSRFVVPDGVRKTNLVRRFLRDANMTLAEAHGLYDDADVVRTFTDFLSFLEAYVTVQLPQHRGRRDMRDRLATVLPRMNALLLDAMSAYGFRCQEPSGRKVVPS